MSSEIEMLRSVNHNLHNVIEVLGKKITELEELGDEIVEAVKYGSDEDLYRFVAKWESLRCIEKERCIEKDTFDTSIADSANLPFPDCGRLPE